MSEYIDREAAYEVLTDYYHHTTQIMHDSLKEGLSRIPVADVVPVRRGRWIEENVSLTVDPPMRQWHCSECGRIRHWFDNSVLTDYCPHCGARMDGAE